MKIAKKIVIGCIVIILISLIIVLFYQQSIIKDQERTIEDMKKKNEILRSAFGLQSSLDKLNEHLKDSSATPSFIVKDEKGGFIFINESKPYISK